MYSLIHEEYKNKDEVDEVLYLVEYISPDKPDKKIISSELHYIKPRKMATYVRGLASEAWHMIMTELNTYGIEAAKELLEHEIEHQEHLRQQRELEEA